MTALNDELLRELAFTRVVERGLQDSDAKRTISNTEMKDRIKSMAENFF